MTASRSLSVEPDLFGFCPVAEAVGEMALAGVEERGAVFTRREVVDFILDLTGYECSARLHEWRFLEPSFGDGDFLLPAVERLLASYKRTKRTHPVEDLSNAIRAIELHAESFTDTSEKLKAVLENAGLSAAEASNLVQAWLRKGDYLLTDLDGQFDVVAGNPPYVRQELIPDVLMSEYRRRYKTIFDRADIYVPFIERSLSLLSDKGVFGFICA